MTKSDLTYYAHQSFNDCDKDMDDSLNMNYLQTLNSLTNNVFYIFDYTRDKLIYPDTLIQFLGDKFPLTNQGYQFYRDVKFKTFGCGAAVATSSMATELVKGKTIYEALEVTNKAVMEALDGLPPVKVHCSLLAEEAIHAALWDYAEKNGIKIEGLQKPKNDISEEEEEEDY